MPRRPSHTALVTKANVQKIFQLAEEKGFVVLHLKSEDHCIKIRQRIYAYRSGLRKQSEAHTGIAASHFDDMKPQFFLEHEPENPAYPWTFIFGLEGDLDFDIQVEIPDWMIEEEVPSFDAPSELQEYPPPIPLPDEGWGGCAPGEIIKVTPEDLEFHRWHTEIKAVKEEYPDD